jgi:hypothetical protein
MSAGTYKLKIFKIAIAACAATVLSAGYALDSTRHFLFRAREPVKQWALGDRNAHTNVGRGDLDHCIPENNVRQTNIRFVSMLGCRPPS